MSTMSATETDAVKQTIADDFAQRWAGQVEQEKIDTVVSAIKADAVGYQAGCVVGSAWIYFTMAVKVTDDRVTDKTFEGTAWGIGSPGGGASAGGVWTNDLNALYANATQFEITLAPFACNVLFFDQNNTFLGYYAGGGFGTVTAIAAGKGNWS